MLADNVIHPFNEWLALTVDYGIVALLLFALVICLAIRTGCKRMSEERRVVLSVLAGMAVFG